MSRDIGKTNINYYIWISLNILKKLTKISFLFLLSCCYTGLLYNFYDVLLIWYTIENCEYWKLLLLKRINKISIKGLLLT